jgi:hypothetical protein
MEIVDRIEIVDRTTTGNRKWTGVPDVVTVLVLTRGLGPTGDRM